MKDSPRPALGYLAAFTLGLVCMAAIFLVMRKESARQELLAPPVEKSAEPPKPLATPRPQTFNRLHRESAEKPVDFTSRAAGEERPEEAPGGEGDLQLRDGEPRGSVAIIPVVVSPRAETEYQAVSARGRSGRISGKVLLRGEPPPERVLPLEPVCAAIYSTPPSTRLYEVGKDQGLAGVVVSISLEEGSHSGKSLAQPVKVMERGCQFEPYISAIQTGQTLRVENQDSVFHLLHMTSTANGEVTKPLALLKGKTELTFRHPEAFITLKCDVHYWEFAYVSVLSNPFFVVTDRNGNFVLPEIPAGKYKIEARHRKAGSVVKEVEVAVNRESTVNFALEVPKVETVSN